MALSSKPVGYSFEYPMQTKATSTDSTGVSVWTLRTCVVERVHRGRCCGVQMQCYHFHVEREHDLAT